MTQATIIEIGTLATGWYWSDCTPYEVIEMTASGKTITIREMEATPTKDFDYFTNQDYTYTSNPNGRTHKVRQRKQGGWKSSSGLKVSFGNARKYEDPHQ